LLAFALYIYKIGLFKSMNTFLKFSIGLVEDYVFYIMLFLVILINYLFVKPFITWFVTFRSIRLLSYIFSSLIVILLLFIIMLSVDELNNLIVNLIEIALHCLAFFGIGLVVYQGFQKIIKKYKKTT